MSSLSQNKPIDFLIITALPEERDAVLALLIPYQKIQLEGSSTYYKAKVAAYAQDGDYEVVVTMLNNMGNVEASNHVTRVLQDLAPDYVMMVGIAGGVRRRINLGDVIVSKSVLYYEIEKISPDGNDIRPISYNADPILLDRTQNYNDISWKDLIQSKRPENRSSRTTSNQKPEVLFGIIATGEKVVAYISFIKQILQKQSKVIGFEMESFGVAVAAANNRDRPRFIAIRGVCDYADPSKNDRWHRYAAESAAAFAIGFLRSGPVPPRSARIAQLQQDNTIITIRHQSMEDIPEKAVISALPPEFAHFQVIELVIDQTDLYRNRRLVNPLEAVNRQIGLEYQLQELLRQHPQAKIAYYGIAHIPLLFLSGYHLSNRRSMMFFDFNRRTNTWNQLQLGGDSPSFIIDGIPKRVIRKTGPVVVRISISYEVRSEIVHSIVPHSIASIHLGLEHPELDIVNSEHQSHEYSNIFRQVMDHIHEKLPNATSIHIFYAGPPSVAFQCGQKMSKTIHPHVIVYNYFAQDTPNYSWGLDITSSITSPNFLIQPTRQEVDDHV